MHKNILLEEKLQVFYDINCTYLLLHYFLCKIYSFIRVIKYIPKSILCIYIGVSHLNSHGTCCTLIHFFVKKKKKDTLNIRNNTYTYYNTRLFI